MKKFLFVCGGTGGHIFPAVAIAESLKKLGVTQITFAGRKDSMEERLVAKNWPYEYISAVPLHRGPFLKNLALPFNLTKSLVRAKSVVKKVAPDVVIATGGYVSLPIVLAAGSMGIPVYLQEQNAVAGIANKVGARYAKMVFVTSEEAMKGFPIEKTRILGNPIRDLPVRWNSAKDARRCLSLAVPRVPQVLTTRLKKVLAALPPTKISALSGKWVQRMSIASTNALAFCRMSLFVGSSITFTHT
jgi:UDP-N-acetylglucosamine:LPS N-acetylglucosamine transferase